MRSTVAGHVGGVGRWGLAVLAGMLFLSVGCFAGAAAPSGQRVLADLTESDVVGSWQDARDGSVLTFTADGRFKASHLRKIVYYQKDLPPGFDVAKDRLPGSGDWYLDPGRGRAAGVRSTVSLAIRELAGRPASIGLPLDAVHEGDAVVLITYLGDPDLNNRIVYQKCQGKCSVASQAPS